jgi:hypothetical protein
VAVLRRQAWLLGWFFFEALSQRSTFASYWYGWIIDSNGRPRHGGRSQVSITKPPINR